MKIRANESTEIATWEEMAELFQDLGYFPADDVDAEELCAYDEKVTGLDAPAVVTIVAHYRPTGDFYVTIAACSYAAGCRGGQVGDMFYTFIDAEDEHVTVDKALEMLNKADEARNFYIQALKAL